MCPARTCVDIDSDLDSAGGQHALVEHCQPKLWLAKLRRLRITGTVCR